MNGNIKMRFGLLKDLLISCALSLDVCEELEGAEQAHCKAIKQELKEPLSIFFCV